MDWFSTIISHKKKKTKRMIPLIERFVIILPIKYSTLLQYFLCQHSLQITWKFANKYTHTNYAQTQILNNCTNLLLSQPSLKIFTQILNKCKFSFYLIHDVSFVLGSIYLSLGWVGSRRNQCSILPESWK